MNDILDLILEKYNLSWTVKDSLSSLKLIEEVDSWEDSLSFNSCYSDLKSLEEATKIAYKNNSFLKAKAQQINLEEHLLSHEQQKCYNQNVKINKLISSLWNRKIISGSGEIGYIRYNQFHTVTRRLTDSGQGVNILTLKKAERNIIPSNSFFLEIDYNAFEPRTALALSGKAQPDKDFYLYLIDLLKATENITLSRDEAKRKMLTWMYDDKVDKNLENALEKEKLLNLYYDGSKIKTPFGREIWADPHHAISYLIQSTANDIILELTSDMNEFLMKSGAKTKVAYVIHDAVMFDIHEKEKNIVPSIIKYFENTKFGKFKLNISVGQNTNNMRKI